MKKIFVILTAMVIMTVMCLSVSAAVNSNHLIDEGFPRFNSDETEWDVFGWTVVSTKVTAMGYKLDGGDIVWVDESIDTRETAAKVDPNDCFEDLELERAIIDYSLTNGLDIFFGYRIHITLDTSEMTKGMHTLEPIVKYDDDTVGNPFRDSIIDIEKTKAPSSSDGEAKTDEGTKAEDDKNDEAPETESPKAEDPKPEETPETSDAAVVAISAVAGIALAAAFILKKSR